MERPNIKDCSIAELSAHFDALGEPRHRALQVMQWLYQKGAISFGDMTNLPLALRRRLDESFTISSLVPAGSVRSRIDRTEKFLLRCADGALIETVLMETGGHQTICISSQIGCPLRCAFCRTGRGGFVRNLRSSEILDQILFFKRAHLRPRRRFNIVLMGMGEPLLNLTAVTRAIEIINAEQGLALGEKRITVSTIGIPEAIDELAASNLSFGLALSLNATTEAGRKELMPAGHNLSNTLAAAQSFALRRKTRVTLEYVLIEGINDSDADASRLAALTAGRPFKINLIPFNPWEDAPMRPPSEERLDRFIGLLLPRAPAVTVRRSQGGDIGAACGQLRALAEDGDRDD